MNPQADKNIQVFEHPAGSLMNSSIERKTYNDFTENLFYKRPGSLQIGIGFISIICI
jgi:hypothetical protein